MTNLGLGFTASAAAIGFVAFIVWQWRSNSFIDPILSAYVTGRLKRPTMWFTTAVYGLMAALMVVAAFHEFTDR